MCETGFTMITTTRTQPQCHATIPAKTAVMLGFSQPPRFSRGRSVSKTSPRGLIHRQVTVHLNSVSGRGGDGSSPVGFGSQPDPGTSRPMPLGFQPMPFGYSLRGHCRTERRKDRWFGNPKGIVSSRPGLPSPRGYPGLTPVRFSTPTGLADPTRFSQGSSRLATLGFGAESLWDSALLTPQGIGSIPNGIVLRSCSGSSIPQSWQ